MREFLHLSITYFTAGLLIITTLPLDPLPVEDRMAVQVVTYLLVLLLGVDIIYRIRDAKEN